MPLDLNSYTNALRTLREALNEYMRNPNDIVRDSCIQRFEYCYAMSTKMLRRFLEATSDEKASIDEAGFPDLVRIASERGLLLNGWDEWWKYRDARNMTSHTYDKEKALLVMAAIPGFAQDAEYLLAQLEKRNQ